MKAFFALTIPVPAWIGLLMTLLMLVMNELVRQQLKNVRWFYENRPAPLPDGVFDERCACGHEWGMHLGAKLNHACAEEYCYCKSFTERTPSPQEKRNDE